MHISVQGALYCSSASFVQDLHEDVYQWSVATTKGNSFYTGWKLLIILDGRQFITLKTITVGNSWVTKQEDFSQCVLCTHVCLLIICDDKLAYLYEWRLEVIIVLLWELELRLERNKMSVIDFNDAQIFSLCPTGLTEDVVNICQWY